MNILYLIPAREGSKGIPGKNLKPLNGKPLLQYTIEFARGLTTEENICLSTDSGQIARLAETNGLNVPFIRPAELATDKTGMYEVIMHAIQYYEDQNRFYDALMLLQPTSPFRNKADIRQAIELYKAGVELVVSVCHSKLNPQILYITDKSGYLTRLTDEKLTRRQEMQDVYTLNGAVYLFDISSLKERHFTDFEKIIKFEMDEFRSIDLDSPADWSYAEFLLGKKIVKI